MYYDMYEDAQKEMETANEEVQMWQDASHELVWSRICRNPDLNYRSSYGLVNILGVNGLTSNNAQMYLNAPAQARREYDALVKFIQDSCVSHRREYNSTEYCGEPQIVIQNIKSVINPRQQKIYESAGRDSCWGRHQDRKNASGAVDVLRGTSP